MPLAELRYFSDALQKHVAANIILPNPRFEPPYPVMFLLHGLSDDQSGWCRRTSIERYCDDLPWIVVMPDGGRGFYTDAEAGFAYETAVAVELPRIIERYLPTVLPWCVTGLSMGGYGAIKLALKYGDRFASAVSHSGAVHFSHEPPNLATGLNGEFDRIVSVERYGGREDLYVLAERLNGPVHLRLDCGTEDHLIEHNRHYHRHLEQLGIPHEYYEFPGEHNWAYWDLHVQEALKFHDDYVKSVR